jgi:hypothetical protein
MTLKSRYYEIKSHNNEIKSSYYEIKSCYYEIVVITTLDSRYYDFKKSLLSH